MDMGGVGGRSVTVGVGDACRVGGSGAVRRAGTVPRVVEVRAAGRWGPRRVVAGDRGHGGRGWGVARWLPATAPPGPPGAGVFSWCGCVS